MEATTLEQNPIKNRRNLSGMLLFVVGLLFGLGSGSGLMFWSMKRAEPPDNHPVPILNPTPTQPPQTICLGPVLPSANNSQEFETWANPFVRYESGTITYQETNVKTNTLCSYPIHLPAGTKLQQVHLHQDEPFISYIDSANKTLHLYNISTHTDKQIDLLTSQQNNASESAFFAYDVYYDNRDYYIDGKSQGSTIVVVPKIFYGGCETDCGNFDLVAQNKLVAQDWEKYQMMVTIARTRGTYMQVPRKMFPVDFEFSNFSMDYNTHKLMFYTNQKTDDVPFQFNQVTNG